MLKGIVFLLAVSAFLFFFSCADHDKKAKNEEQQKAQALITSSRCLTCHHATETINGPAFIDIANRYAGRPDTIVGHLVKKVINGGAGEWGEVNMPPNTAVSTSDAEIMLRYILSLRN